ncbi:XrtA system polysaccharide deacetylase [Thermosulfuriphilus sp.]
MGQTILLTIDVEDWFQVENFKPYIPYEKWPDCEIRVLDNVREILKILKAYRARGTFFVLGWLAERLPQLVSEIRDDGHEVASHGYDHRLTTDLSEAELRADLKRSKEILESLGVSVKGYRAPSFTVNKRLLEILKDLGYLYDSSFNPFRLHGRYGHLEGASLVPFEALAGFYEIPVSSLSLAGGILPWGGGAYFRLIPGPLFLWGVKRILRQSGLYVFYLHPWELDPRQPRVQASWGRRFRHYYNLSATRKKLEAILRAFPQGTFKTCTEYLEERFI